MSTPFSLTRRKLGAGAAAAVIAGAAGTVLTASAACAQSVTMDDWKQLIELYSEAKKLGINLPSISAPATSDARFGQIISALVDFLDALDAAETKLNGGKPEAPPSANGVDRDDDEKLKGGLGAQIENLEVRASKLLNSINARERHPRQGAWPGRGGLLALLLSSPANAAGSEEQYRKYRDGYIQLFNSAVVNPSKVSNVAWYVDKLSSPTYRSAYEKLEEVVCVPWYFIGVIHALETSFNFRAHLHNGDPLDHKTTHVPAGRPVPWLPPSDWQSSAKDALTIEGYVNHTDWNLARLLFRLEGYNGFRSREQHGINSPYLWSFSNHYTSGKFVADNVWSSTAVSQQCGAAVMIKELVNRGVVVPVA